MNLCIFSAHAEVRRLSRATNRVAEGHSNDHKSIQQSGPTCSLEANRGDEREGVCWAREGARKFAGKIHKTTTRWKQCTAVSFEAGTSALVPRCLLAANSSTTIRRGARSKYAFHVTLRHLRPQNPRPKIMFDILSPTQCIESLNTPARGPPDARATACRTPLPPRTAHMQRPPPT